MRRLATWLSIPVAIVFTVFVGAVPAHATVPSSHLRFKDNRGDIYSVYISGPNSNGTQSSECMKTPTATTTSTSWWGNKTYVYTYLSSDCSTPWQQLLWITPDGGSTLRCLIDTSPYTDWNC